MYGFVDAVWLRLIAVPRCRFDMTVGRQDADVADQHHHGEKKNTQPGHYDVVSRQPHWEELYTVLYRRQAKTLRRAPLPLESYVAFLGRHPVTAGSTFGPMVPRSPVHVRPLQQPQSIPTRKAEAGGRPQIKASLVHPGPANHRKRASARIAARCYLGGTDRCKAVRTFTTRLPAPLPGSQTQRPGLEVLVPYSKTWGACDVRALPAGPSGSWAVMKLAFSRPWRNRMYS